MVNTVAVTVASEYSYDFGTDQNGVQIRVKWTTPDDAYAKAEYFQYRSAYANADNTIGAQIQVLEDSLWSLTQFVSGYKLSPNTNYYVSVRQKNKNEGTLSPDNWQLVKTLEIKKPNAPNITLTLAGGKEIRAYIESNNNGKYITSYSYSINGETYINDIAYSSNPFTFTPSGTVYGTKYTIYVTVKNEIGTSDVGTSNEVTPYTNPGAATITSIVPSDKKFTINFTGPSDNGGKAIYYYAFYVVESSSPYTLRFYLIDKAATTYTITPANLTNGTQYNCYLRVHNSISSYAETNYYGPNSTGTATDKINITPCVVPGKPGCTDTPVSTNSDGTVSIAFSAASTQTYSPVTSYDYVFVLNSDNTLYTVTSIPVGSLTYTSSTQRYSYNITPPDYGVAYKVKLRAINAAGPGDYEFFTSSTNGVKTVTPYATPGAPTIAVTNPSSGTLNISFTNSTFIGGGSITHDVWYSSTSSATPTGTASETYADNLSHDIALTNGTVYHFYAKSKNTGGLLSAFSNLVSLAPYTNPAAPTITVYTNQGSGTVSIVFVDTGSTGGGSIIGHDVWYSETSGTPGTKISYDDNYDHTITGLTNGTPYYFYAKSKNTGGRLSEYSLQVGPITPYTVPGPPDLPYGGSFWANGASISADFFAPADTGGNTPLTFDYQLTNASGTALGWYTSTNAYKTPNPWWHIEIYPEASEYGSYFTVQLRSRNNAGVSTSDPFFTTNGTTKKTAQPYIIPAAPSVTLAISDNNNEITATVTQGNMNGSNMTGYYYKINETTYSGKIDKTITTTSFTFPFNGVFGTPYYIYVKLENQAGAGAEAKSDTKTPIAKPSTPSSLTVTAKFGRIDYTIGAATANGKAIDKYYYKVNSSGNDVDIGTTLTGTIYNLANNADYTIYAKAHNELGDGDYTTATINLPLQTVSIIPTKNYFFYNNNSLDTIFALNPYFNNSTITNYKMNTLDIGKRYKTSGTGASATNYKISGADLNGTFLKTTITYTSSILLPVDRLSLTTKNVILPNMTTDTNIHTADPTLTYEASIQAGVYGCKLLFSSYTGPVMTIRSSINNVIGHFYADSAGTLGSEYLGTGTSLSTWLNGATPYVQIWWDQTGNKNHAYQFDSGSQPTYNSSSKYISFTGTQYFKLPNKTHPYDNMEYTYVFKCSINTQGGGIFGGGTADTYKSNSFRSTSDGYVNYWFNYDITSTGYAADSVISLVYSQTNRKRYIYKGGSLLVSDSPALTVNRIQTPDNNTIGRTVANEFLNGYIQYMYIIPLAISTEDRNILEST